VNYADAKKKADEILEAIRPFCHRAEIAGSIRRKKSTDIKDIEICAIPNSVHARELADIVNKRWGEPSQGKFPSKYTKVRSIYNIDFFWPSKETWGLIYFIRTGPAEFGQRMLAYWKTITEGGYSEEGQLRLADGTIVPTLEEEDVFRVLEQYGKRPCPFLPPERRLSIKKS
jgi:DNA polymerase/3'-5' exonuclease PolX